MRKALLPTNYFLIMLTFLVGLFLTIIPLPHWAIWARPQFMLAILLFWAISSPSQCEMATAFFVGVLMDLVVGTTPGQHALVFVLLVYVLIKCHAIVVHLPQWQQAVAIGVFAGLNGLCQGLILGWMGHSVHLALQGLSAVTTIMIWPLLFSMLDRLRPKAFIR